MLLLLFCGFFIHVTLFPNCISQYACSAIFTFLPINCERIHYYIHQMVAIVMRTCSHFTSTASTSVVCVRKKKWFLNSRCSRNHYCISIFHFSVHLNYEFMCHNRPGNSDGRLDLESHSIGCKQRIIRIMVSEPIIIRNWEKRCDSQSTLFSVRVMRKETKNAICCLNSLALVVRFM